MWHAIETAYDELPDEPKKVVLAESRSSGEPTLSSTGWDGNTEGEYIAAAEFWINKLNRFREFKRRDLDRHGPAVDVYRRMLPVFDAALRQNHYQPLSAQELVAILKERIHPENR